jgi:hypothetical protein
VVVVVELELVVEVVGEFVVAVLVVVEPVLVVVGFVTVIVCAAVV